MSDDTTLPPDGASDKDAIYGQLKAELENGSGPKWARFAINSVSGAIPFVGGVLGAAAGVWSENEEERFKRIFAQWLKLHEQEMKEIAITMAEIMMRLDLSDERIRQRVESPEYQALIRKAFRDWSAAESEEKRSLIRRLLCNAAASTICSDDVVKLFIEWIRDYSELHFRVIRVVYQFPGATRAEVWDQMHGVAVREDSAEADLFKCLIHDLTTGYVIRQHRETDGSGNFKRAPRRTLPRRSPYMQSAFEDGKEYELTSLGRQFVHYTMNEIVPKIGAAPVVTAPAR